MRNLKDPQNESTGPLFDLARIHFEGIGPGAAMEALKNVPLQLERERGYQIKRIGEQSFEIAPLDQPMGSVLVGNSMDDGGKVWLIACERHAAGTWYRFGDRVHGKELSINLLDRPIATRFSPVGSEGVSAARYENAYRGRSEGSREPSESPGGGGTGRE